MLHNPAIKPHLTNKVVCAPVIVAALGNFVDIYDLMLFGIVRVRSLQDLGLAGSDLLDQGIFLLNIQMIGMLVGGVICGVLGDKRGRLSALFGSILLYSLANLANAHVTSMTSYSLLRFLAGVGLAGEMGAGITLVSEILNPAKRGYGTAVIVAFAILGAMAAAIVGENFDWRLSYTIGGVLGLIVFATRFAVHESGLYVQIQASSIARGNFFSLFTNGRRLVRYLCSILVGLPIWFVVGILVTFSPEFASALHINGPVTVARTIIYCNSGMIFGCASCAYLSHRLESRRAVLKIFLGLMTLAIAVYFTASHWRVASFNALIVILGFTTGYTVIYFTVAAEQFGTNLRATVATTVPNFVRVTVVPMTLIFQLLKQHIGPLASAGVVGAVCLLLAIAAIHGIKETFGQSLDFIET